MPELTAMLPDESDPNLPLPADAPVWARLLDSQNRVASRDRRELVESFKDLSKEMRAHNKGAEQRHSALLDALRARDAGTAAAIKDIHDSKSWPRVWAEKVGKESWSIFKVPLGFLVSGAISWFAWKHFEIPPTPTPMVTVESGDEAPTSPASTATDPASSEGTIPSPAAGSGNEAVSPQAPPVGAGGPLVE